MDVVTLRKLLFERAGKAEAQHALRKAKDAGISLHNLLEGTILDGFLDKEITKFSACDITHLPNQRYDFRLNDDFSFSMEISQLDKEAAMPIETNDVSGNWELMELNDEEFVLKLNASTLASQLQEGAYLKVSHQDIGWIDKI